MRYVGIDLLKIIAMLFIMSLHIDGHGGIINLVNMNGELNIVLWMWEAICICAVNIYALASGYLNYKKKVKFSRYIMLWLQVVFFGLVTFFVFKTAMPKQVSAFEGIKAVFPVTFNQYWYFTAYTAVFILCPMFNLLVENVDKILAKRVVIIFISIFSCYATLGSGFNDTFDLKKGYGVLWLAFLYIIGALIKKYENEINVEVKQIIIVVISSWILTWSWKIGLDMLGFEQIALLSLRYTSPTVVIVSIGIMLLSLRIKKESKILSYIASSSFAAYLFQDNNLMRNFYIRGRYSFIGSYNSGLMMITIWIISIVWFLLGVFIDKIRIFIFRVCNIDKMARKLDDLIDKILNYLVSIRINNNDCSR